MNRRCLNSENKYVKVEQKIKSFDYKILDEFKDILGYKCQKATVIFEERNYELWFTDKINTNDGPWVFCGLPGLILEAKTTGGKHQFVATSIMKSNPNHEQSFDFPYSLITDYDSYKKDFIDSRVKKYKYNKSKIGDTNGTTSFTIDNLDFPLIVVE